MNENKKTNTLVLFLKETWFIWTAVAAVLMFLGFFSTVFSVFVPSQSTPYVGLGVLLAIIPATIVYFMRLRDLNSKNADLENALKEKTSSPYPSLFIEGVPVQSLLAHIDRRKREARINPVQLELFDITVKVTGDGPKKDADVVYRLKGENISSATLSGLNLTIAGDNLVPLTDLQPQLFDLMHDPERKVRLVPNLVTGLDSVRKDLFLPFLVPGVGPHKQFDTEFRFYWPFIFNTGDDYWFLDNVDFQGRTRRIRMVMTFDTIDVETVRLYTFNSDGPIHESQFLGALKPEGEKGNTYSFEMDDPEMGTYFIMIFSGKER